MIIIEFFKIDSLKAPKSKKTSPTPVAQEGSINPSNNLLDNQFNLKEKVTFY